jgi:hypothetical protein
MGAPERVTPLAAILSAGLSIACCMPLGIAGGAIGAGAAAALADARPWLLLISAALLTVGFVQLRAGRRACARRSRWTVALLYGSAGLVAALILFPQQVAGLLADLWP